jgi:hypothetical protein
VPTKKVNQPLSVTHPELAKEADGWDPTKISAGSGKKLSWICSRGHVWQAIVRNRTQRSYKNCPTCNSLYYLNPELAGEADGWDPSTISAFNGKKMPWICSKGHQWQAVVANRAVGVGCPICSGHKVLVGFNDLETTHPTIASEADGWDPKTVTNGNNKNYKWKCSKGHSWTAAISSRAAGNNCPICGFAKVLPGFNDLKTTNPDLASQAKGWDPTKYRAGSHKKVRWVCSVGHEWDAVIGNRSKGTDCPACADYGFNFSKNAFLYFLAHPTYSMYQIGITNDFERRISEHRRNSWELIDVRGPMDGLLAQKWESAILKMLKAKGADLSNSKIAGKFDGYSEAWSKSTFEAKSIKELMRLTEEFEGGR